MPLTMQQTADAFSGEYLKADDLQQPKTFLIKDSYMAAVGDEKVMKPIVEFECGAKLVLNQTNHSAIVMVTNSPDPAGWNGKYVILHRQIVEFKGKMTPAIRVDVNKNPNVQQAPVQQAPVQQYAQQQQFVQPDTIVQQPLVGHAPAQQPVQQQSMQPAQSYQKPAPVDTTPPTEESELFHGDNHDA